MAAVKTLEEKINESLKGTRGITTKKMFGGLCYLHNGNMLCGIMKDQRLMVRVGNEQYDKVLKLKHAKVMDFTKKVMRGMIYVEHEGLKTTSSVKKWVEKGLNFTRELPRK